MNIAEENFIVGIHNYCDRWCERCTFTGRCRVAEAESDLTDEERDIRNEAFWRKIAADFAEAERLLIEGAEKFGIEITPVIKEDFARYEQSEEKFIREHPLAELADRYRKETRQTLENKEDWLIFSLLDDEMKDEMLSVVYWYQFFIAAKIRRGLQGLIDFDGNFDETEIHDPQSDSNGSIKIALIAIERSIAAWTNLLSEENSQTVTPHISLLQTLKQIAEKIFPDAQIFVRPGFDEIEIVM